MVIGIGRVNEQRVASVSAGRAVRLLDVSVPGLTVTDAPGDLRLQVGLSRFVMIDVYAFEAASQSAVVEWASDPALLQVQREGDEDDAGPRSPRDQVEAVQTVIVGGWKSFPGPAEATHVARFRRVAGCGAGAAVGTTSGASVGLWDWRWTRGDVLAPAFAIGLSDGWDSIALVDPEGAKEDLR